MAHLPRPSRSALLAPLLLAVLPACAQRVWMMVPPKIDLAGYERIGLVELECSDAALGQRTTQRLQEQVLGALPGMRLVLIGVDALPGGARSGDELDAGAIRALADEHGLDALLVGTLRVSKVTPTIGIDSSLVELGARADIHGALSVRLLDPESGATFWTRSAEDRVTVAAGGIDSQGRGSFGVSDSQAARWEMVCGLASRVTEDFRAHYYRKHPDDIPPGWRVTYPDGVEVWVPPEAAPAAAAGTR